jgi:hypothetical protein
LIPVVPQLTVPPVIVPTKGQEGLGVLVGCGGRVGVLVGLGLGLGVLVGGTGVAVGSRVRVGVGEGVKVAV